MLPWVIIVLLLAALLVPFIGLLVGFVPAGAMIVIAVVVFIVAEILKTRGPGAKTPRRI